MQFKHPEVLYFLALLLIPVLVHLFQLQRFVKTPFTNVSFLQKLSIESRKSSRIKKWLILLTRLLSFFALILAFSQPYFSNKSIYKKQHTFIYLDNSLSTQAKGKKGKLLQIASQEIIENTTHSDNFSLLTNDNFYRDISSNELKNILLKIKNTANKIPIKEVLLKISTTTPNDSNLYKNIIISDFQNTDISSFNNNKEQLTLVQLQPEKLQNVFIDSIFTHKNSLGNFNINVQIRNTGLAVKNIPIAIYNKEKLISKQTFSVDKNERKTIVFTIQKTVDFLGKLNININDTFGFDNTFYFTINTEEKINVLAIGKDNNFLSKIYTKDDFYFTNTSEKNINYNLINKQQLILLNELKEIPNTLATSLINFCNKGGNLAIIPNEKSELQSYNSLLKKITTGSVNTIKKDSLKITKINFSHPLLNNVFNKKVSNFQYPLVQSYFPTTFKNTSNIISFENNKGFIKQVDLSNSKLFWIASPLNNKNSNFINSPLIVPVFYNIGQQSLQLSKLYYRINHINNITVNTQLNKDAVLLMQGVQNSFIPLQKVHQNNITLTTSNKPLQSGFYYIINKKDTLKTVAYNYPTSESSLQFLNGNEFSKKYKKNTISTSIKDTFQKINKNNKVHWLWKWFLAIVIVSLLLEILIIKFFKV